MTTLVTSRPEAGATPDWSFPSVQRSRTDGVQVVAAHLPARPLVHAVAIIGCGALADPNGAEGTASLLGSSALRGAAGRDEHALAVAFERVGAVPGVTVHMERTELSLEVPSGLLEGAVSLLADVLRRADLAEAEVSRVRDARVDSLRARVTDVGFRAARATVRSVWAPSSRFSISATGEPDVLTSITPDAVARLHADRWAQAPVTLVLVGDLEGVDLEAVARPLAGGDTAMTPDSTVTDAAPAGRIALVDVPGAVQSVLRVAAPGPAFGVGDEAGLEVAQTALFASFGSRLNLRLREELGYTYGASGGFTRLRDGGWWQAGCSVRTEVTAESVAETVGVLRTAVEEGLSDDEVAHARDNLVQKFPVRYDGPGPVSGALVRRVHHGLADDERDAHLDALRAVTTQSANEALRAALDPGAITVTVAGAAGEVRAALAALDLGEVVDAD